MPVSLHLWFFSPPQINPEINLSDICDVFHMVSNFLSTISIPTHYNNAFI